MTLTTRGFHPWQARGLTGLVSKQAFYDSRGEVNL
jgi:hypothetical protein